VLKVYVATAFKNRDEAKRVMELLKGHGCIITHDWTNESVEGRTGDDLMEYLRRCAWADVNGVKDCDVLFLINHPDGKGCFTELGIALGLQKHVVVVEEDSAHNIFIHLDKYPIWSFKKAEDGILKVVEFLQIRQRAEEQEKSA
jgi:nucleoside 2-deoxyribosyltransferase